MVNLVFLRALLFIPLNCGAVAANALTLVVLLKGRLVAVSLVYVLILNMAVADFLASLIATAASLSLVTGVELLGSEQGYANAFIASAMGLLIYVDKFSLTAATAIQGKSLTEYGWLEEKLTKKLIVIITAGAWLVPFFSMPFFEIPAIGMSRMIFNCTSGNWQGDYSLPWTHVFDIVGVYVISPLLAAICISSNVVIYRGMQKMKSAVQDLTEIAAIQSEEMNVRMARQFVYLNVIYLCLFVCEIFFFGFGQGLLTTPIAGFIAAVIFEGVQAAVLGGNFFVYYGSNQTFRASLKELF